MSTQEITSFLLAPPAILGTIFTFVLNYLLKDAESRKQIGDNLYHWKVWNGYVILVKKMLNSFDIFFGSKSAVPGGRYSTAIAESLRSAFVNIC